MYMLIRFEEEEMYTQMHKTLKEAQQAMVESVRDYNEEGADIHIGTNELECIVNSTDAVIYCGIYIYWKIVECEKPE